MSYAHIQCLDDCKNKDRYENCSYKAEDGEAIQCVNPWAEKKYYYLEQYLSATRSARAKFAKYGNAVYLDLFAGPGVCRIKKSKKNIPGGALRVLKAEAPFNRVILNDFAEDNCNALRKRTPANVEIHHDDANIIIDPLVDDLLKTNFKYHFVYLDPFAPSNLKFNVIRRLSEIDRVDIIINFPLGPIRRNYKKWIDNKNTILDEFLGTSAWRERVKKFSEDILPQVILGVYLEQFLALGFPAYGLNLLDEDGVLYQCSSMPVVRNSRSVILYYLFFASKHPLAASIWNTILKYDPSGQQGMF